MKTQSKTPAKWRYVFTHSSREVFLAVAAFALLAALIIAFQKMSLNWWPPAFADYLDPIIALGTLVAAILVWVSEKGENWRSALPKKLNILYLIDDGGDWKIHVTVINAPLVGESDIRQWGQSIGQTIFPPEKTEGKPFDPTWARIHFTGFHIGEPELDRSKRVMRYNLLVFLRGSITGAKDGHCYVFDDAGAKWRAFTDTPPGHAGMEQKLLALVPDYSPDQSDQS